LGGGGGVEEEDVDHPTARQHLWLKDTLAGYKKWKSSCEFKPNQKKQTPQHHVDTERSIYNKKKKKKVNEGM